MEDDIKRKILALLDQHRIMTVATLRPDGWPQATTVGYVNEGLTLAEIRTGITSRVSSQRLPPPKRGQGQT
jgi:hypothetical protein